ncbi:hypothetical protein EKO04_002488 [Ascochyta lentis]|uniref:Uncharacterized protein n=1 Tax=Ascochyta lentis TaxID=205686 RepID=A0A8H7J7V6_9PLEO|nr:hypothetical protein EKO04_002488 [Ascochyta lentis]
MIGSLYCALLLAVATSATPLTAQHDIDIGDVKVASNTVLNLEDGLNHEGINASAWESQLVAAGFLLEPPETDHEWLNFTPTPEDAEHVALAKRQDCINRALVTDKTQNFVDWDVQMSPVICANGPMTVSVTDGYSVANSITVSAGMDYTWIADKLKSNFGVNFQRTWTTTATVAVGGTVPDGNCGCMIWKPLTTRRYGSIYEGCVGALKKTGTFMADDRGTGSYNGIQWISGARSLCYKKGSNPPLSRCQGSGNFV